MQTLVLFCPDLSEFTLYVGVNGTMENRWVPESSSFEAQEAISHWRKEIDRCSRCWQDRVYRDGQSSEEIYVSTGEKQYSGKGRNHPNYESRAAFVESTICCRSQPSNS